MESRRLIRWGCIVALGAMLAACASDPTYFVGGFPSPDETPTIAVLPPLNLTRSEPATDIITNSVTVELLSTKQFLVSDPGLVEDLVLQRRLRLTDRLSLETLRELGEALDVTYLLLGTINEFAMVQGRSESLPSVSVTLRIVTCANGRIAWAASHSRRGDDEEHVFGLGKVLSLEQLAALTVREMMESLGERKEVE